MFKEGRTIVVDADWLGCPSTSTNEQNMVLENCRELAEIAAKLGISVP
jgi:hypothetical protein